MHDIDIPGLIVGGVGAGLTSAMLLSRLGVDSLVVSALPSTSVLPKAHVTDVGLAEEIYERSTPAENMRYTAFYVGVAGPDPADRFVAWRSIDEVADPAAALTAAFSQIPSRRLA